MHIKLSQAIVAWPSLLMCYLKLEQRVNVYANIRLEVRLLLVLRSKGKLLLVIMVAAFALLASGCSQPADNAGGSPGGSGNQPVFTYAMSGAFRPFNYYDVNNQLTGFDVEIGKALAQKMGMEPKPIATPWQGLINGLKSNRYDAIIGSMAITDDRLKEVDFSDPYYITGGQVFVKKGSPIRSVDDLTKDTKIGVTISTTYETRARQFSSNIYTYDSDITALRDLDNGRLDAVITDRFVGEQAIKESGLNIEPVGGLLFEEKAGIAVRKGDSQLLEKINKALKAIKDDGTYLQISQKYFGRDISKP